MSPEPSLDATGIARRQFSTSRKGNDPAEVRAFLHEVSDLVGRLQRSEAHERERAERAEQRAKLAEQLDEHRMVELLGEETARVLEAAREAEDEVERRRIEGKRLADEMRRVAEQQSDRMLAEGERARAEAEAAAEQI